MGRVGGGVEEDKWERGGEAERATEVERWKNRNESEWEQRKRREGEGAWVEE